MNEFTGIKDFEFSNETCFICGQTTTSLEHVFPKWLQKRFNLWDQKLILPNQTKIPYRQLTVPCCSKCNGDIYGVLENKISNNLETESDIWKWANKIHIGLTVKDSILDWDRKNPEYKIGEVISPDDPLEQSRHFLHCLSGDFKTTPDPFGSVFKFSFDKTEDYNFIHIINSSSILISLGDRGYVVFTRDGQFLKNNKVVREDYEQLSKKALSMAEMLFFYAKNIELLERFEITNQVLVRQGQITKLGTNIIDPDKPANKEMLTAICQHFGITWIDSEK